MRRKHHPQLPVGAGIFPFLSVLNCAIGALLLILIANAIKTAEETRRLEREKKRLAMVLEARTRMVKEKKAVTERLSAGAKAAEEERAKLTQSLEALSKRLENRRARLAVLARGNERAARKERDLSERVQRFRREITELRGLPNKIGLLGELRGVRTARDRFWRQADAAKKRLAALENDVDESRARFHSLRAGRNAASRAGKVLQIRFVAESRTTGRRPVYIELGHNQLTVRSVGLSIEIGTSLPYSQLWRRGVVERLARDLAERKEIRFAMFLVRPGGLEAYRIIAAALRRRNLTFAYEPVEASRRLRFVRWLEERR